MEGLHHGTTTIEIISIPIDVFNALKEAWISENVPILLTRSIEGLRSRFPCLSQAPLSFHQKQSQDGHNNFSHRQGHGGGHGGHNHGGNGHGGHGHGGGGYGGHGGHRGNRNQKRSERTRIGTRELSREDMSKKDFLANMNKLSRQNYDSILRLIRTTYNSNFLENYMDMVWELMRRQADYQDLHIQVILHLITLTPEDKKPFISQYWGDSWKAFCVNQEWLPPSHVSLKVNDALYDDFCDYVKWKKRTGASIQAWVRLMSLEVIPSSIIEYFTLIITSLETARTEASEELFDCIFEWLLQMFRALSPNTYIGEIDVVIGEKMIDWRIFLTTTFPQSSTRFKLLDLVDIIERRKSKNISTR